MRTSFCFDLLSTLTFDAAFKWFFDKSDFRSNQLAMICFHVAFILKFLRFSSFKRAQVYLEDFMQVITKCPSFDIF